MCIRDRLVLDLPPGTGDVQLTMIQKHKPAGAVMETTRPCPRSTLATAFFRMSRSRFRPVKALSPSDLRACQRVSGVASISSKAGTGSECPWILSGPLASVRICPLTSARVLSVMRIVPGWAAVSMRAARFTVGPTAS